MLQSIRENSQGWLAWLVVGLISIPFALWGINSYLDGGSNVSVAKVNGQDISLPQYQNALQNYQERLQQMFGDNFDVNSMEQDSLKQEVVSALVDQEVLLQLGQKSGMRVSDQQVSSMIKSMNFFQDESGQFSNAVYERKVLQSRRSPVEFEQQLRSDMVQEQLRLAVTDSEFITASEENRIGQLQAQTRNIVYTTITSAQFEQDIEISDTEINEYYEENKENYKTDESVRIKYIDLSIDELAKNVEVDLGILQDFYQTNLDKYTIEEQRVAQHIFIALTPDAKAEEVSKANESASKLLELVKTGIDFDDIPQQHADLLSAQDEVGKTGSVSKGVMDPEFDEAMFSLSVGDFSDVVRSKRGYHVIKLVEIKPTKTSTFEEAKEGIESEYRKEQAEAKYFEVADELQNLTYENQDSLDIAAETLDFEIKETQSFTRDEGEELTRSPSILNAAFSEKVLQGANSEPIELSDTRLIVLRAFDHKAAIVKDIDSVKEVLKTTLLTKAAKEKAQESGEAVLAKLNEGVDLEKIAKENSVEWIRAEAVIRDDANVKRSILRTVFKLGRPADDKPIYKGFTDGISDYAVVGVNKVIDADVEWSGTSEDAKKTIEQLEEQRSTSVWQDFVISLKQNAKVEINSEAL